MLNDFNGADYDKPSNLKASPQKNQTNTCMKIYDMRHENH
jgi:hypothetical protein